MKEYSRKGTGSLSQQVIKIRLNMTGQKANHRNKYGENLKCLHCDVKEATIKHVLSCSKMPPHQLTKDDLYKVMHYADTSCRIEIELLVLKLCPVLYG